MCIMYIIININLFIHKYRIQKFLLSKFAKEKYSKNIRNTICEVFQIFREYYYHKVFKYIF